MSTYKIAAVTFLTLTICVQHKHAANVGGEVSDLLNRVRVDTTTPDTTTLQTAFILPDGPANITIQAGATVTLHCRVSPLVDNTTVSWLKRHGDRLTLVSVGLEVYSSDPRYTVLHNKPNDWGLQIKAANLTDQGHYECQVSSHPPVLRSVFLHIVVPETEIADERSLPIKNKFYNSGSTIELRCVISKVPQPTQFIIWRHNNTILNYDTTRGGISVKTDITPDGARSQLYIGNVGPADSGNYTCSLGEVAVTSVAVVVITGETPAAMQHGTGSQSLLSWTLLLTSLALLRQAS